ncbi:unnamed protein product [Linum trigynum]|uniref:Uncharacterized protein n=1 Tax=Linum trigynum TaxID=586398 RepID=A0AAV2D941_9ROSI
MAHNYDVISGSFIFGEGENRKVLSLEDEDVARFYALPHVGEEIVLEKCLYKTKLSAFQAEIGMGGNRCRNFSLSDMVDKLTDENARPPVRKAVKQFILLALASLLRPSWSRICELDYAEFLLGKIERVKCYNGSGLVVAELKSSLASFQGKAFLDWVHGDVHFLIVHLLDFLKVKGVGTFITPTCSYWFKDRQMKVVEAIHAMGSGGIADLLMTRPEIQQRFGGSVGDKGQSSTQAPDAPEFYNSSWWEKNDLERMDEDQVLKCMSESMFNKWKARLARLETWSPNVERNE